MNPQNPWLAALASFLCPGLGQLYNGEWLRALGFGAAFLALWLLATLATPYGVFAYTAGFFGWTALVAFSSKDAAERAPRRRRTFTAPLQASYLYTAFALVLWVSAGSILKLGKVHFLTIPSNTMAPTILLGDKIAVHHVNAEQTPPLRGEVVVFRLPREEKTLMVGRVIAGPGDLLQIRNWKIEVNGTPIEQTRLGDQESLRKVRVRGSDFEQYPGVRVFRERLDAHAYDIAINERQTEGGDFHIIRIPPGQYFVMGDNRSFASDSRSWGFVPAEGVIGRALYVFTSTVPNSFYVRWSRIGERL